MPPIYNLYSVYRYIQNLLSLSLRKGKLNAQSYRVLPGEGASASSMSTASRRAKWRPSPPPPPSPKILHFPRIRRARRKQPCAARSHRINPFLIRQRQHLDSGGNLPNLCSLENESYLQSPVVFLNRNSKCFSIERRNRVEEGDSGEYGGVGVGGFRLEEDKWMFQAEILRAECNFLRMEREFALKKLERNRVKADRTLRSAVQTLISGRKKIFEGKNVNTVLEKEIEELSEQLEELHRRPRVRDNAGRKGSNFDTKACLLERRFGKLREIPYENSLNGLQGSDASQDIEKQSCVSTRKTEKKATEVDELSKKTEEGLSMGMMLERALEKEEHGSMLTSAAYSIVDSSVPDSKGVVCPNLSSFSTRQESTLPEDSRCSGHCRAIVHQIVEQVRAETEQWSQMQEMLERVRGEMEELQASHDFWEKRAHSSVQEIQSLKQAVEEWKRKALSYETRANELGLELSQLQEKLHKAKAEPKSVQKREAKSKESQHFHNDKEENKDLQIIPLGEQLAKERKMLLLCLKDSEREHSLDGRRRKMYSNSSESTALQRVPLQDIGNSAFLNFQRQN